jgi:hypothetical protein
MMIVLEVIVPPFGITEWLPSKAIMIVDGRPCALACFKSTPDGIMEKLIRVSNNSNTIGIVGILPTSLFT